LVVKKLLFLLILAFGFSLKGTAQTAFSNEWIKFEQQYFKIPVAKDGIYRLTFANLQASGFPVGTVDPRLIQIFHRGQEQSIIVQGEADAKFDATDYIEFYGQRNDGTLDAKLYFPAASQPHPYYNLYSDTTAYFLTYSLIPPKGKRMTSFVQTNSTGLPKETSQNATILNLYTTEYSGGNTVSNNEIQNTFFDIGEGWTDTYICTQNLGCTGFKNYAIENLVNGVSTAGNPKLEVLIVGRDQINHQTEVYVGPNPGSLRQIATQGFSNFETFLVSADINFSDIGSDGKMTVQVKALGAGGFRDKVSVSFIKVTFPQTFDLTGQTKKLFGLQANAGGKSYVEIATGATDLRLLDITAANDPVSIGSSLAGGIVSAVIPNTTSPRILLATNEINSPSVRPVVFQEIDPKLFDYVIITHASLLSASQAFGAYRASAAGGNYLPITITVDQLYNQFNYGEVSPVGIFEFMKFMVIGGSPKYLFLIGKGRDVSYGLYRQTTFSSTELRDLVPSAGLPASDMSFTSHLNGSGFAPAVATGRLSASTPAQVTGYLSKVREIESTPPNTLWRKKGLHLSGGIEPDELVFFRSYLDEFKAIGEGDYWGGKIATIGKHDPTAVEQINISDQVNSGVNLITFFGHSSPGTIDIDIGKVSDPTLGYNNPGKYPVFLINGCNAGNFFSNTTSFGEDWMLSWGKGARGFIAHSYFGFVLNLKNYSELFYNIGFGDSTFIKMGIGDVQKKVAEQYLQLYGTDITNVTQAQQMVLLGDPAVKLFGTATPDYETDDTAISLASLDGKPVTAVSDSFAIDVIVKNFGAVKEIPLRAKLVRTYSDNTTSTIENVFGTVFQQDTLRFILAKDRSTGFGNNQFTVSLDPRNEIPELIETNNSGTARFAIPLGGTQNLYPVPYGIVGSLTTELLFQTTSSSPEIRDFQVEVDTVNTFNSPYLTQKKVSGLVLPKLPINLLNKDSLVYYWRTRFDKPKTEESNLWTASSFTFINNSPNGWIQKEFPQLNENEVLGLVEDVAAEQLKFIKTSSSLLVTTYGSNNAATNTDVSVRIDNQEFNLATQGQPCRNNTINFVAFNKTTLVPYAGLPFNFQDPRTCGREPQVINSFMLAEMETGNGDDVLALVDSISASDSVLVFSIGDAGYSSWSAILKAKLNLLGIQQSQLVPFQNGDPLIILGRKDAPAGTAKIFVATPSPANTKELKVATTITGRYTSGSMTSVLIGPATKWKQLIAQAKNIEAADQYSFILSGVSLDGKSDTLQVGIHGSLDLSAIDARKYPYLRLGMRTGDEINLSPVQLSKWLVLYDPVPEGVLFYTGPSGQQIIAEGASFTFTYDFVNISNQAFSDSLTVNHDVLTHATLKKESRNFKIHAPLPGMTESFKVTTATTGKAGVNDVNVFVNRKILAEQYYENNGIDLGEYLFVKRDTLAPVLDVTVDGRYLANDDFVLPDPFIQIRVKDENRFIFKSDTTGISVILTYPCSTDECTGERIYFSRQDVKWFPATATSDFRVEFRPKDLVDGAYVLSVQATDASGNRSGAQAYEIQFRVKNENTFAFQSVYPNPSSSSFFFNFLLTGNESPDVFILNLYSADGRLLQGFSLNDIREFHIGANQLIWNPGEDNSPMPPGVYIFKMTLTIGGRNYGETGKLILMR
jgi:Peptidase family C25